MRRRRAEKREPNPDAKCNSRLVAKFINTLMYDGKKTIAENIVYDVFEILEQKTGETNALKVFNKALENVRPRVEVKARRVGGATYQVPIEVPVARGHALAMRWIRRFCPKEKRDAP
jgi:small subunit ribosomal protein S7